MPDDKPDKPKIDFSKLEQYSKESEWRMRNQDGIEYGPYTLEQLLQFAKEGRISIGSELQNSTATKGKWVRTVRIKAVADLIALNIPTAPTVSLSPPAFPQTAPTPTENNLFEAISQSGSRQSSYSNAITQAFENTKSRSHSFVRSTGRSWFVVTAHLIATAWLIIPFGIAPFYGWGVVQWLTTGGLPGIGGDGVTIFAVPVYLKFAFPGIFLSVLAEILHAVTVLRR